MMPPWHIIEKMLKKLQDDIDKLKERLVIVEIKCPYCNGSKDQPNAQQSNK